MPPTTTLPPSLLNLPKTSGPPNPRPISILLINPNSTASMTLSCLSSLTPHLPPHVTVTGFTAPHPSPSAIESTHDAVMSTAVCLRALQPLFERPAQNTTTATTGSDETQVGEEKTQPYDAYLIACFSTHPLIPSLREALPPPTPTNPTSPPVLGILEASLHFSLPLTRRIGLICTSHRSKTLHEDSLSSLLPARTLAGVAATGLGVLELESLAREEVLGRVEECARELVEHRGAEVLLLGCAGFSGMVEEVGGRWRHKGVVVVDAVRAGVGMLVGMCIAGVGTAKGGVYSCAGEARERRGQEWL